MLWMVRDRRRYAMLSSPFMVAYGNLLIVLQYIWSFETMEPISGLFVRKDNPFHSLSSKVSAPVKASPAPPVRGSRGRPASVPAQTYSLSPRLLFCSQCVCSRLPELRQNCYVEFKYQTGCKNTGKV